MTDDRLARAALTRLVEPGEPRVVRLLVRLGVTGLLEQLKKMESLIDIRRRNAELFVSLFQDDPRFIIQRELGESSWFAFTIVLNPELSLDRARILRALKAAGIEYRIVTGGCFLRHDVIRYYDYETVGDIVNANTIHDRGFFVGNHPYDLTPQLLRLREVLDEAAR